MTWAILGISLTAVGLALRLYFLGRSEAKLKGALELAEKRVESFSRNYEALKKRSEARIDELKQKNAELLLDFLESSSSGDRRDFLNGLLSDEDSEDPGGSGDLH